MKHWIKNFWHLLIQENRGGARTIHMPTCHYTMNFTYPLLGPIKKQTWWLVVPFVSHCKHKKTSNTSTVTKMKASKLYRYQRIFPVQCPIALWTLFRCTIFFVWADRSAILTWSRLLIVVTDVSQDTVKARSHYFSTKI